jgi:hypothetical protein
MENGTIRKTSFATTQKSHCNIQKSSIATSKKPIATWRKQQKGVRNSKEMDSRCRLF